MNHLPRTIWALIAGSVLWPAGSLSAQVVFQRGVFIVREVKVEAEVERQGVDVNFADVAVMEDEVDGEDDAVDQPNPNDQIFGPEVLDQWLFQNGNEQTSRKALESQLVLRMADVERTCELTEPQRKKLQLAGRAEIKTLFDRIDQHRRNFQRSRRDQRRVNQLWQEIQPLRLALTGGHFGDASLFDKVVRKTLTAEQLPRYLQQVKARRQYRHRARLEMVILSLDKEVPLRAEQREQFLAVLEEIPPVKPGPYEPYALMYVASKLPEERFQKILDEAQWNSLEARFEQARNLGEWLKQTGALATDDPLE